MGIVSIAFLVFCGLGPEYSSVGQTSLCKRSATGCFLEIIVFFVREKVRSEKQLLVPGKSNASFRLCLGVLASLQGRCKSRLSSEKRVWSLLAFWKQVLVSHGEVQ